MLGYITGNFDTYSGDLKTFILNFIVISVSYNGAWWFFTTYIILVALFKGINRIIEKYNSVLILSISFTIYFVCYIQRIKGVMVFDNAILNWAITQIALLGTSRLPYLVGAIFADKKICSKIYERVRGIKFKNVIAVALIVLMVVLHGFLQIFI